jgi:preprotein translocase subunit SecG
MQLVAQMNLAQWFLAVLIILVCSFLMLVVLVQRGRGGGLSAAFGGGGGSSAFGAKTGDVFTWITVVVAVVFLLLTSVGKFVFDRSPKAEARPVVEAAPGDGGEVPADLPEDVEIPTPPTAPTTRVPGESPAGGATTVPEPDLGEPAADTDTSSKESPVTEDVVDTESADESTITEDVESDLTDDSVADESSLPEKESEDPPNP